MAQGIERRDWGTRARRSLGQVGPIRLALAILLLAAGVYLARYDWQVPLLSDVERAFYDLRLYTQAERAPEPDSRIALVVYNDATLRQLGKRSPLDRAMLARALRMLDRMGPRAIGIDILFDQPQDEDDQLVDAFRAMRTPTFVAFASHAANPDQMEDWQEEFLRGFLARAAPGNVHPASIKLEPDLQDGVVRRWTRPDPRLPPLLSAAMAGASEIFARHEGAIDYVVTADPGARRFPIIAIEEVASLDALPAEVQGAVIAGFAERLRGRHVLIGGDINDVDDFETPMTRFPDRGWTKGIEIHGEMLAQQLDGRLRPPIAGWTLWMFAVLIVAAGGLTAAVEATGGRLAIALVVQLAMIAAVPFLLHNLGNDTLGLPAFGWGAGWLLAFVGVGNAARAVGSEQRRFAQSALGKYLPRDIATRIMRDPEQLRLRGEKKQIFAVFTDLEGFTKLSHSITPEQLSSLLNRYLDLMSDTVLTHGGTIDKFVGDAVVAVGGAPIARPDDADRAVRAAIDMFGCGEQFRKLGDPDLPPIGCTRVGLHYGEAVVGNFGGEGRIQYTALGDGMNTAARLESANKQLKTCALVSAEAKSASTLDLFRPMGRIVLSGRATPVEVWEPVPEMDAALRARLGELWRRFDGGDAEALDELEEIAASPDGDAALAEFVYRLREAGPGGHFVLGSK